MKNKLQVFLITLLAFNLSELTRACDPPDCNRPDCGTCANACCTLEFYFGATPQELMESLTNLLKSGGPDGLYTYVGSDDLTPYKISVQFMVQGVHTSRIMRYNDTIDFTIYSLPKTQQNFQSRVRAFSLSQIHGAYCDDGQNYKNLVFVAKNLAPLIQSGYLEVHIAGCLPPIG